MTSMSNPAGRDATLGRASTAALQGEDLWTKAMRLLSSEDQQRIRFSQADKLNALKEILVIVHEKQGLANQKQWKLKRKDGREIVLRDVFKRITDSIDKFKNVVLQAAVNESQTYTAMFEGLERISSLITRYAFVEAMYLKGESLLEEQLSGALVRFYTSILVFLAQSLIYYARSTGGRLARGIIQTSEISVGRYMENINELQAVVENIAGLINTEYLRKISTFLEEGTSKLLNSMSDLSLQVESLSTSLQKQFSVQFGREQLLQWIDAIFTDNEYERALIARVQGTCEWILQRSELQNWMRLVPDSNSAKILWIYGYPGFGKTILAAWLTEYLRYTVHEELGFFFCYFGDERMRQPLNIVRSWISQLLMSNDNALSIARETYTGKYPKALDLDNVTHATELDVWLLFKRLNVGLSGLVFVVDGFDECMKDEIDPRSHTLMDARERFLKALEDSIEHTNARILIVSRGNVDVRNRYRRTLHTQKASSPCWLTYGITREDTQDDIRLYTRTIVNEIFHKRTIELRDDIVARLIEKCDGMFLYLRRIQPRLKPKSTMGNSKLRAIIENTPSGLDEAYGRDLQTILELESEDRDRALSLLRWVLYAARPLTVRELAEALLISAIDDESLDKLLPHEDLPETWDKDYTDEQILGLCGSLVDLRGGEADIPIQNQTVHFVHFTVKEYLSMTVDKIFPALARECFTDKYRSHDLITKSCLRYLCFKDFQQKDHSTISQFNTKAEKHAFLRYAAFHMPTHLVQAQPWSQPVVRLCNALLDPAASRWLTFSEMDGAQSHGNFEKYMQMFGDFYPNPLYYASLLGMFETINYLLGCGLDVNIQGGPRVTPLQAAASSGHTDCVKLLLDNRADVNFVYVTSGFGTALQAASAYGHEDIVNMLLENGANANLSGGYWNNCIIAASASLAVDVPEAKACRIIKRLIRAGAGIMSATGSRPIALHEAAFADSAKIIETLLDNGADINSAINEGMTALHMATKYGRVQATRCLLTHDADRNALTGGDKWTALHCAAGQEVEEIVTLLLDHGADVDSPTQGGMTPLSIAAAHGRDNLVKCLLVREADVNTSDCRGWSGLHVTAENGYEQVAQLLLDHGAGANSRTEDGSTPLISAATFGHNPIVVLVLDYGGHIEVQDSKGNTPLHRAAINGHEGVVELLIERGANLHSRDRDGNTPLHKAARNGHERIVKLLIDNGVKIEDKNNIGSIP